MPANHNRSLLPAATALLLTSLLPACASGGPDLARESRLAEQTIDAILDGEPVELVAGEQTFLGIFTPAEEPPARGAALILHGRGMHPDWGQVANPIRTALPGAGRMTLSLQMPVLAKDAKYYDYIPLFADAIPRINAGIRYLQQQGAKSVVMIAHSCSVHMSMAWLAQQGDDDINAYIGIGMGATDYKQPMKEPFPFEQLRVPLLNVYGSNDYPAVHRLATDIELIMDNLHPASSQIVIDGADHYFEDYNEALTGVISTWLNSLDKAANQSINGPDDR